MIGKKHGKIAWIGMAAALLALALAGCGGSSSSPTNAAYARTDAELLALAQAAWDATYSEQTNTPLDGTSGPNVGDGTALAVETAVADAVSSSVGSVPLWALARPGTDNELVARELNATATSLQALGARRYTSLFGSGNCAGGGTFEVTGTYTVTASGNSYTVSYDNVEITLDLCSDGSFEITGSIRYNADQTITLVSNIGSQYTYRIHLDEYVDGGLAIHELPAGDYHQVVFRRGTLGTLNFVVDGESVSSFSGEISVDAQTNNVSCTATITFDSGLQQVTGSYSCTIG